MDTGNSFPITVDVAGHFQVTTALAMDGSADGPHTLHLQAADKAGNVRPVDVGFTLDTHAMLPGDMTVATTVAASSQFLYTGPDALQTGVADGTIDSLRAAVLRGKVLASDGSPVAGVSITVLNHPELGVTHTQADGIFSMVVNGGPLTLRYQQPGFFEVQRQVEAPWQDYAWAPDVVLTAQDNQVTAIDLSGTAPLQVARATPVTDSDGTRQATVFFPAGTHATLVLPNGTTQAAPTLHVRATEYTVGAMGPQAMPGELPPTSGYTYAAEFSADEAVAAGATGVTFDQPVIDYTENFLHFSVGSAVPTGSYDRTTGQWIGAPNGRVVQVLSVSGGLADLDLDGSGQPAAPAALAALGVGDAERQQLATLYAPGQSLWRVPLTHFSPWDHNWPFGPPADALAPKQAPSGGQGENNCNCSSGSVIRIQNQALGEDLAVAGTPFTLHYQSDRQPGAVGLYTVQIPLSDAILPNGLKRIDVEVEVAGQLHAARFPAEPNLSTSFTWDGKDAFGRAVQGQQQATVRVGYVYSGVYYKSQTDLQAALQVIWANNAPGTAIDGDRTREQVTLWTQWQKDLGTLQARGEGLGGWTLDVQHAYQPATGTLYLGDGSRRSAATPGLDTITTVAGNGDPYISVDGVPATQTGARAPSAVAVGPDGSLYFAENQNDLVRKVDRNGIITTVAGTGVRGYGGDGGPATQAQLYSPNGLAVGPDGSVYISDWGNHRVRRVSPDAIITTVAGTGDSSLFSGDDGPATQARLRNPTGLALSPDGSLYIVDSGNYRVRRVGPDGIIHTVAGNGSQDFSGDGGPATKAALWFPSGLTLGPDGSLYISENQRVRRVGPDGIISTVAGSASNGFAGDDGPATQAQLSYPGGVAFGPDGSLYIADTSNNRIRRVDPNGTINTVVGGGSYGFGQGHGDSGPASKAELALPHGIAFGPDGSLYIADYNDYLVRRVASALPGLSLGNYLVPSEDGSEAYLFNAAGKHLRTLDALTGAVRYQFSYDGAGRLAAVTDRDGNVTTIERDAAGNPTLVAPGGQRTALTLNASGYLRNVKDPTGATVQLDYDGGGLLNTLTDARNGLHQFAFDTLGRLIKDADPAGGFKAYVRTEQADGYTVTETTAEGVSNSYQVEDLPDGSDRHTHTDAAGLKTVLVLGVDGSRTTTSPDGTVQTLQYGPDPRFGVLAPVVSSLTITVPSSPSYSLAETRSATLSDPKNPLSLTSLTDTVTLNGNATTSTYDGPARTLTIKTPLGHQSVVTFDARGHVVTDQEPGQTAVQYDYDPQGRRTTISQGPRATTLTYYPDNTVHTMKDPLARTIEFVNDAVGRPTQETLPDGQLIGAGYDASGNLTSVTPPGQPVHTLVYTATDLLHDYVPPSVGPGSSTTEYQYNRDHFLTDVQRPDGSSVVRHPDNAGRLDTLTDSAGVTGLVYDPTTGQLKTVTAPDGGSLTYGYAGNLLTDQIWAGSVAGTVHDTLDSNFRVASQSVDGASAVSFLYDPDGFLYQAGDLTLKPDPQTGLLQGTILGQVSDTYSPDNFAQVTDYQATAAGAELFAESDLPDAAGRSSQKTETIDGVSHAYIYSYDGQGRLTQVDKDGTVMSKYVYDGNGNRLSYTGAAGTIRGMYDPQDRLTQYGSTTFTYTASGERQSQTDTATGRTTSYVYDALGNLRSVALADGTKIDYVIDGQNRRIGKKVNGTLVQGFLYDGGRVVAELDGAGHVVSRLVYTPGGTVPVYMIKDGVSYGIIADRVGSPRLIVNAATGAVVQRLDYDEFGNVLQDTNPGFQPFGFAGGLYDRDTGLLRFGARDYDPQTGRWTAKDPIGFAGGDANLYAYVGNDPVNRLDPRGTDGTAKTSSPPPDGEYVPNSSQCGYGGICKETNQSVPPPPKSEPNQSVPPPPQKPLDCEDTKDRIGPISSERFFEMPDITYWTDKIKDELMEKEMPHTDDLNFGVDWGINLGNGTL
jgi:RHS repeat-associated protein